MIYLPIDIGIHASKIILSVVVAIVLSIFSGIPVAAYLEGPGEVVPLLFSEKQTIAVEITDAYMDGDAGIPYTACEVFSPTELMTKVYTVGPI